MHQLKLPEKPEVDSIETGSKANTKSSEFNIAIAPSVKSARLKTKLIYILDHLSTKPRYFLVFILARFHILRQLYRFFQKLKPDILVQGDRRATLFEQLDSTLAVKTLQQEGLYLGLNLPHSFLVELLQYLSTQDCYAGGETNLGFKIAEKKQLDLHFPQPFYVARYFNLSTTCPQIIRLANDPKLQQVARSYIGKLSKYIGCSLFWTFPIEGESMDSQQQMFQYFHYDIDDFAGVRFCFYLTDVSLDDGPHVCVRGSHIKKRLNYVLNFLTRIQTQEKLAKTYALEQFLTIADAAGSGFIEDTFCFHKGNPPKTKPRLFLQLHFASSSYHQGYLDDRDPSMLRSWRKTLSR